MPPRVRFMTGHRAAFAALLLASASAAAQTAAPEPANLRGDSGQTRKRLAEAEKKLLDGHAADAVEGLQRVLDDAGDDLVAVDARQHRPARWVAHQVLARLPADALAAYRDRVDVPARKLLDAGKKNRDPAPLWQLLDRYFVSRPADEGLLLLGDLLFDRGEFRTAEGVWRRLLPDAGADVVYPGSKADAAAVRARLVLAAAFAGDLDRAREELATLKRKHPDAKGHIAGKDGPYAATLQAYLDAPPKLPPRANRGTDWPEFGGGPDHSARLGNPLPHFLPQLPAWRVLIPPVPRHTEAPATAPRRPPVGHPVIADGHAYVTDGTRVFAYDLATGKSGKWPPENPNPETRQTKEPPPDPCPAMTAAGGRLYVRTGPPLVRSLEGAKGHIDATAIVCLAPQKRDPLALEKLWELKPPEGPDSPRGVWEGAPVVAGRRMWAAYARFEGGRVVQGIACYDPADTSKETGPPRLAWAVDVCDSVQPATGEGRARQELLTLAGRNVVFNSNAGAVVALDAVTGRSAWGFRYPRANKAEVDRSPYPSPAVACAGRVFVAPADGERVYALDAETGRLLWESGPTSGAHVLGVAAGRLVVETLVETGGQPLRHDLRGLNLATGSYREDEGGWIRGHAGFPVGYGRGFVTDDVIVWPTRAGLFFIDAHDGDPVPAVRELHLPGSHRAGGSFGNVVYADGVLVVVTPTEVLAYAADEKRLREFRGQSARAEFEALAAQAEDALRDGDRAAARAILLAAAKGQLPRPFRAWAAARALLLSPKVSDEAKLPADLLAALTPELRAEWVLPPDGVPATVGTLLDRHLGREAAPPRNTLAPLPDCGWKPEDAPTLPPTAAVARTVRFDAVAVPLGRLPGPCARPSRLFATTAGELVAVPLAGGEPVRFALAGHFTHAAELPEGFVVVGPLAVAVYARGREPEWVFRMPQTAALPAGPGEFRMFSDDAPRAAELSAFRLAGPWLVARLGERHLIALDLRGKRVAWVLGADGRPRFRPAGFPGAPRFGAEFLVTGRLIVAQLSTGRRWFVSLETGLPVDAAAADQPTAAVWWAIPPAEVDAGAVAVSDGAGLVRLIDPATGAAKWAHREERDASLTGEPPQVRAWGRAVLVAVRRNHGVELDRLDAAGNSAWPSGVAFLDADRADLAHADADLNQVYVPAGNTLATFALKTGRLAWEVRLPDAHGAGGWVVRAGRECVIAYPEFAIPREPIGDVLARAVRSLRANPEVSRLPALAAGLYDAWVARTAPVLLFDPETGKQLARFDIPAAGPHVAAWFERDLAVVATGDRMCWLK